MPTVCGLMIAVPTFKGCCYLNLILHLRCTQTYLLLYSTQYIYLIYGARERDTLIRFKARIQIWIPPRHSLLRLLQSELRQKSGLERPAARRSRIKPRKMFKLKGRKPVDLDIHITHVQPLQHCPKRNRVGVLKQNRVRILKQN